MKRLFITIILLTYAQHGLAKPNKVPLPQRSPLPRTHQPPPELKSNDLPVSLPERNPKRTTALAKPDIWSDADITKAQKLCSKALNDLKVSFKPIPPIKKGTCGTPFPIQLQSIGIYPEIKIKPSAKVNCQIAAALNRWLTEKVQPLAKSMLNKAIIGIRNVSSYSCRRRYGSSSRKMSEHAFANAIDILVS